MKFWSTGTKHQALEITLLDDDDPFFGENSMCVKLLATLNIQLEYVLYTWGNAQSLFVPSLKTLSAALKTVASDY